MEKLSYTFQVNLHAIILSMTLTLLWFSPNLPILRMLLHIKQPLHSDDFVRLYADFISSDFCHLAPR